MLLYKNLNILFRRFHLQARATTLSLRYYSSGYITTVCTVSDIFVSKTITLFVTLYRCSSLSHELESPTKVTGKNKADFWAALHLSISSLQLFPSNLTTPRAHSSIHKPQKSVVLYCSGSILHLQILALGHTLHLDTFCSLLYFTSPHSWYPSRNILFSSE